MNKPDVSSPKLPVALRWERLRSFVLNEQDMAFMKMKIGLLADQVGCTWYLPRYDHLVEQYIVDSTERLLNRPGFGVGKLSGLCDILEAALIHRAPGHEIATPSRGVSEREQLQRWSMPMDYPCKLMGFSGRVLNFLESREIDQLSQLLDLLENTDVSELVKLPNLGRTSVKEFSSFLESVRQKDISEISRFLPINAGTLRLDVSVYLESCINELEIDTFEMMQRRLIHGLTLEETAQFKQVTRERVRQLESKLLTAIKQGLEYFSDRRDCWFDRWMYGQYPVIDGRLNGDSDMWNLIEAAVISIFEQSPEGQVKKVLDQNALDECWNALIEDPILQLDGVPHQDFMNRVVPERLHDAFNNRLMSSAKVRICPETGLLMPYRDNSLKGFVMAMLECEIEPRGMEWLSCMLNYSGKFPYITPLEVQNQIKMWVKRDPSFPRDRVILDAI